MMPFEIYALPVAGGTLALSPLPGRGGDYADDLVRVLEWVPDLVLSMTQQQEMDRHTAAGLAHDLGQAGIAWRHFGIPDFGVPGADAMATWPAVSDAALSALGRGGRVLAHCFGGCGRSGMIALRLMIAAGEGPEVALKRLRAVRPCAVETDAQMDWAMAR